MLSRSSATSRALLGYSHPRLGEHSAALRLIEELDAASQHGFVPALLFALVYAGLDDQDQAFRRLEKAYEERFYRFAYLKVEALWDPLRSDPRFADLLRGVGIPPYAYLIADSVVVAVALGRGSKPRCSAQSVQSTIP